MSEYDQNADEIHKHEWPGEPTLGYTETLSSRHCDEQEAHYGKRYGGDDGKPDFVPCGSPPLDEQIADAQRAVESEADYWPKVWLCDRCDKFYGAPYNPRFGQWECPARCPQCKLDELKAQRDE